MIATLFFVHTHCLQAYQVLCGSFRWYPHVLSSKTSFLAQVFRASQVLPGTMPTSSSVHIHFPRRAFKLAQQWGAADAEIKRSHLMRTQSLKILPLKPGVGQYIAVHATLTARDFFLAYFYPSGPFTCIFPTPLSIFPVLAVARRIKRSSCRRQIPVLSARGI